MESRTLAVFVQRSVTHSPKINMRKLHSSSPWKQSVLGSRLADFCCVSAFSYYLACGGLTQLSFLLAADWKAQSWTVNPSCGMKMEYLSAGVTLWPCLGPQEFAPDISPTRGYLKNVRLRLSGAKLTAPWDVRSVCRNIRRRVLECFPAFLNTDVTQLCRGIDHVRAAVFRGVSSFTHL